MEKKHELGISVYPDLRPLEEIEAYFKLASQYGVSKVFTSLFSADGTPETLTRQFQRLTEAAHRYGLKVSADVNPMAFELLGATPEDLSPFAEIGFDTLRMDLSFGPEEDAKLVNNRLGLKIEFNISKAIVTSLLDHGIQPASIHVCHNFYPQRYTALKWEKFLQKNRELKACAPEIKISAFVSSTAPDTHGVWDASNGLPSVEKLRDLPVDLQARLLLATNQVDDILIGNACATEEELKALEQVVLGGEARKRMQDPVLDLLVDHGLIHLDKPVRRLRIRLEDGISQAERDALLNIFPHVDIGDSSEWIWRSRISRFQYSQEAFSIVPRPVLGEWIKPGAVVIVNDRYKHYAGEIQIVKQAILNDGTRNLLGYLDDNEMMLVDMIQDQDLVEFLESA